MCYRHWKYLLLLWIGFVCSCSAPQPDYVEAALPEPTPLSRLPQAEYRSVAWLDESTLALIYRMPEFGNTLGDYRIISYNMNSGQWRELALPPDPDYCYHAPALIADLTRMPDGNLAYTYSCDQTEPGEGISGILYKWNKTTDEIEKLHEYAHFLSGPVTFAPDLSAWIQESRTGDGLNNELYRVDQRHGTRQIFPDFQRVGSPSWSLDGQTVAFIGTETYPGKTDSLMTWGQIEGLALSPWDLYLMDADGNNVRILVPQIGRPYQLKWSPDGKRLFFAGRRPTAKGGIWVLEVESKRITRLWPYNTYFDLSPDGKRMVVIVEEKEDEATKTYPIIVEIPAT
jgi:WD40 repeat protein